MVVATVYDCELVSTSAPTAVAPPGRVNWNADGFGDEGSHDPCGRNVSVDRSAIAGRRLLLGLRCGSAGNWSDFKGSNVSQQFPGQKTKRRIESFALFTGQVGYAWDRTLIYAKGGAAVTDNKYTANSTLPPLIGFDVGGILLGSATLGAGVEYAFAQNWSLGFEYDHLFMGTRA